MTNGKIELPVVTSEGNFIFIIKPEDTQFAEGKILAELPSLEILNYGVGGNIEIVPGFTRFGGRACIAFCNEEGKMYGFPPNHLAQMLWEQNVGHVITNDYLVGNIVIVVGSPSFLRRM
jgi:hypothetical protein